MKPRYKMTSFTIWTINNTQKIIGFLFTETNRRVYISESEKVAKTFAKKFNGIVKESPTGFWLIEL